MSEKKRQKKDGEGQTGKAQERQRAVAARQSVQREAQLPKDKSNHLIGDDEPPTKRNERR